MSDNQVRVNSQQREEIVNSIADGLKDAIRKAVNGYLDSVSGNQEPLSNRQEKPVQSGFKLPAGDK